MPGLYSHTTRSTGTVLTASIYNTDHQNHIDNATPQMTDDYSSNATQMQSNVDPGEVGTESLPTSLAGELERLRFALNDIKTYLGLTSAQWYVTPTGAVALAKGGTGSATAAGARTNLGSTTVGDAVFIAATAAAARTALGVDVLVASTGDVKLTLKTVADSGWVLMDDKTIGDATSGATGRANADTEALFTLLWNNTADAECAVSSGRGANAAADFAAHKTIALPKALGRALATYGAGSGLTSRALAKITGNETHTLVLGETPSHFHTTSYTVSNTPGGTSQVDANGGGTIGNITSNSDSKGGDGAHNNMQPTLFLNTMIKL